MNKQKAEKARLKELAEDITEYLEVYGLDCADAKCAAYGVLSMCKKAGLRKFIKESHYS